MNSDNSCWVRVALALVLVLGGCGFVRAASADLRTVKERVLERMLKERVDEVKAAEWALSINGKGRWNDVDYGVYPQKVVSYSPMPHLERTRMLALAAAKQVKLGGVDTARLHAAVVAALMDNVGREHTPMFSWEHDWYMTFIGAPATLGDALLLAQTVVPAEKLVKPRAHLRDVLAMKRRDGSPHWLGMGANQIWVSGVSLRKALVEEDDAMLARAFETVLETMRIMPKGEGEGMRADAAFHQHGNQVYSGGYGASYVADMVGWFNLADGTSFQKLFKPAQVALFSHVVREGHRWHTYRGELDFGTRGRNICEARLGEGLPNYVLEGLARMDASNAAVYRAWIEHNAGGPFTTPGNRHYWLSDFMVHRGKDWYVSAKVLSTRTDGTETMKNENLLGFNLPLGTTVIMTSGEEYRKVFAIWDWSRIPGTTAELGVEGPAPHTFKGSNPFAGGASDGTNGVLAFASEYKGIASKKAYFALGEFMVCLGADITADGKSSIVTSVNQCFQKGQVRVGEMTTRAVEGGPEVVRNVKWVHHDEVGYVFLKPVTATVQARTQTGSWRRLADRESDAKVSGEVFSLWLDHGKSPRGADYAYLIAPRVDERRCAALSEQREVEVLRNDGQVQAVRHAKLGVIGAVFHKAGRIELGIGTELSVDSPAIVLVSKDGARQRIWVSDPLQTEKKIGVKYGSLSESVAMGDGDFTGRAMEAGATAAAGVGMAARVVSAPVVKRVVRKVERLDRPGDETSQEYVVVSRSDGKTDAFKVVLMEVENGIASVELAEGRRMAWQASRVVARVPWHEAADFAAGHAKADAVLAQYDTLLARYPEARPVLAKDYAVVKGLVDEQKARVALREKARQEALALRYDPAKDYTLEQLEPIVAQLTTAAADYPGDRPVLEQALAGFQKHMEHLRAGDVRVDGRWRPAAEVARERAVAEAMGGMRVVLESRVMSGGEVWRGLALPLGVGAVLVLAGLGCVMRRTFVSVFLGLCLVGGAAGYAWYAKGATERSGSAVAGGAEGVDQVARWLAEARVGGPGAGTNGTAGALSDADVNAFLGARVGWTNGVADGNAVERGALWVESGVGRIVVAERLRWRDREYVVRHELVMLEGGEGVRALWRGATVGTWTLPVGLGERLWVRLEPELRKVLALAPLDRVYRVTTESGRLTWQGRGR